MFRLISYFFIVVAFASCGGSETTAETGISDSAISDSNILKIGDITFEISKITKKEFEKHPSRFKDGKWDRIEIIDDSISVKRKNDSLIFSVNTGNVVLKDLIDSADEASNEIHKYLFNDKRNSFWVVDKYYYEWSSKILVDKNNGNTLEIFSTFDFSPDRKFIVSMDDSMMEGDGELKLYKLVEGKYVDLGEKNLNLGVGAEIKWISEKEILLALNAADIGVNYIKLTMK